MIKSRFAADIGVALLKKGRICKHPDAAPLCHSYGESPLKLTRSYSSKFKAEAGRTRIENARWSISHAPVSREAIGIRM